MKNRLKYSISTLIIFVIIAPSLYGQVGHVWALGDGEKVFREDTNHPSKKGSLIWDGHTIRLTGLYNEVLAFQVIAEVGPKGAAGLELVVSPMVNRADNATIGAETLPYGPGGTVEVFSQHYLHVKDSTPPAWFYGSPAAAPAKMTGWIPDALIPSDALAGTGGFPLHVQPAETVENQGLWVDIHLPRDRENYPPGLYQGSVMLYESGNRVANIPLEITIIPHYLPDENHQTIWVYSSPVYHYFTDLPAAEVDKMLKFEGHRHRVAMLGGFQINREAFNRQAMEAYMPYFNGTAFTPANGYRGPGEGEGEHYFPVGMYAAKVLGDTKESIQRESARWVDWFSANAPNVKYFWYMIDEPGKQSHDWIRQRASWIKNSPTSGKRLPTFTTTAFNEELKGSIDIWAGYDGVDLNVLPHVRKTGGDHWFYNGNRPRYGSVILEAAAVDLRINSWILYKYQIPLHFIWDGTNWTHGSEGPVAFTHLNVFRNPLTFINAGLAYGNGDGILFYPGQMPYYPKESRGLNRLLPSIRLKNIRRGQQDAALMCLAEQKVGKERVNQLINEVIPRALSEVEMKAAIPWSEKGDDYDRVRNKLIALLLEK